MAFELPTVKMGKEGIEPSRSFGARDFKSRASASSATCPALILDLRTASVKGDQAVNGLPERRGGC